MWFQIARRSGAGAVLAILFATSFVADEFVPRGFTGDTPAHGEYSLRISPPGAPSPGGPYALILRRKSSGVESEILRFAIHVDVSWSRDGTELAVSDLGDSHRGSAFVFDLRPGRPITRTDLAERLRKEKPEAAKLLDSREVIVRVQGWQPEIGWTVIVDGIDADHPRGFIRSYEFKLNRGFAGGRWGPKSLGIAGEVDYDAPFYKGAKMVLLDRGRPTHERTWALHEMLERDAVSGFPVLSTLLDDQDPKIRDLAAEYLAIQGDRRGLDILQTWIDDPRRSFLAAQRLGSSNHPEYAERIARRFRAILYPSAARQWSAEDTAFLRYGAIALAQLGRLEDRTLIFELARITDSGAAFPVSALGFVDDPRSRVLLRAVLRAAEAKAFTRNRLEALHALSRLGDIPAAQEFKRILKERRGWWLPNAYPQLPEDRAIAFRLLRSRDAKTFAETVFEVAAQDPEGPGTFEAWKALGAMHPPGFGRRLVRLAWSRRPHWKTVSQDLLNKVVISSDPDLNSVFWQGYEAERIPAMTGPKNLVRAGLRAFLFAGSSDWIGE